ncbi:MAG: hypothetical protein MJB12_20345 [Firmicutes bacterium]|nr:hypothetical protein [Bacillota bacterium]
MIIANIAYWLLGTTGIFTLVGGMLSVLARSFTFINYFYNEGGYSYV